MGDAPARFRALPFVIAAAVAVALVLSAPFIGEIRRAILTRFPNHFVAIVGGVVALAVGAAVVTALRRIRGRKALRFGAIAAALAAAGLYTFLTRTGDPQVDAVERFHFVQYGLITFLFYRAWRPAGDISVFVLPVLAGLLVGTVEEWFQWFIPARVGDVRDVLLNGIAIACGLVFSAALEPPRLTAALGPAAQRRIGAFAAVVVLAFGGFFDSVHVGHAIAGTGWTFRSCYTGAGLDRLAADRTERWRGVHIGRPARLSAEDQYMTEGLWHVQRRNLAWTANDAFTAWNENLILERYFAPVLDTGSYVSRTGHRWSPGHRGDAEARYRALAPGVYESQAHPGMIVAWPARVYWTLVAAAALLLALPAILHRTRRSQPSPPAVT